MSAITGGALAQIPVGRLSDHTDRRRVIAGMFVLGAGLCGLGWWLAADDARALYAIMFFVGATTMPIYALCIATAADNADVPLIQIASGILIVNSLGSIVGPMLVSPLLVRFGGEGFFVFAMASLTPGALWALYRITVVERPKIHEQRFVAVPKTSIVATVLAQPAESTEAVPEQQDGAAARAL